MRFGRVSFIFVFALLLLCAVPIQALAAPNLVLAAQSVTHRGGGTYRCVVRVTNRGTSSTGATDIIRLYVNGTLDYTFALTGDYAVAANDYEDYYADYSLGSASSAIIKVELSSTVSHYATQTVTANLPADAGYSSGGGGGGCSAGLGTMAGLLAFVGIALLKRKRVII